MRLRRKKRRVREFLRAKGLQALLLKRQANFSWMTAGGLNLVGITTELGATSLLITETGKYVISNNIEAPRMAEEENLEALGFVIDPSPGTRIGRPAGRRDRREGALGSDVPFPGG